MISACKTHRRWGGARRNIHAIVGIRKYGIISTLKNSAGNCTWPESPYQNMNFIPNCSIRGVQLSRPLPVEVILPNVAEETFRSGMAQKTRSEEHTPELQSLAS